MRNHTDVQNAAEHLAHVEAQVERAAEALATTESAHLRILNRMQDLDTQRAALIVRRQRGETHPDDAASLALLDADRSGLEELRREAEVAVIAAKQPHDAAKKAVETARWQLQRAEDEAAEVALIEHASRLDELLRSTMGEIAAISQKLRRPRPSWLGSDELYADLRHLRLVSGRG